MSPCTISVWTERPEKAAGTLTAAARLADLAGPSEINVLAFHRLVSVPILAMTDGKFTSDEIAPFVARERGRLSALSAIYDRWVPQAANQNTLAHRIVIEGDAIVATKNHRFGAGFIVVPRPTGDDDTYTRETFRAALFDTNGPVLVVPSAPHSTFGRRVGIAWREEEHARQALVAAVPLLKNTEQIHIFAGTRDGQRLAIVPDVLQGDSPLPNFTRYRSAGVPLAKCYSPTRILWASTCSLWGPLPQPVTRMDFWRRHSLHVNARRHPVIDVSLISVATALALQENIAAARLSAD